MASKSRGRAYLTKAYRVGTRLLRTPRTTLPHIFTPGLTPWHACAALHVAGATAAILTTMRWKITDDAQRQTPRIHYAQGT